MTLRTAIRLYVKRKRLSGLRYTKIEQVLLALGEHVGNVPLNTVTSTQILHFLNGPRTSSSTWRNKFGLVKRFFEYWQYRNELYRLPLPRMRPPSAKYFVPYIYSTPELRLMMKTTSLSQRSDSCMVEPTTFRTLLLFLYGTGMLLGEAMRLLKEDVDLKRHFVTVRGGRFGRMRKIPIGPRLHQVLKLYAATRPSSRDGCQIFFTDRFAGPIKDVTLSKSFKRLRRIAGISRDDGGPYQPRIHDLRHTFAVHRLTAWYKEGLDVQRILPALSAYMGFVGLDATERYLAMTPERLRKQLAKLSPHDSGYVRRNTLAKLLPAPPRRR
jgi:integrase/recombinase XerD